MFVVNICDGAMPFSLTLWSVESDGSDQFRAAANRAWRLAVYVLMGRYGSDPRPETVLRGQRFYCHQECRLS